MCSNQRLWPTQCIFDEDSLLHADFAMSQFIFCTLPTTQSMCRFSLQSKQTGLHHPWPKMKIRRFLLGWIETKEYERKTSCSLCHELPTTKPVGVKFRSIAIICSPLIVSMDYFLDIIRDFLLNWWTLSVNCKLQCYWKFAIDGTSLCFEQWTSF